MNTGFQHLTAAAVLAFPELVCPKLNLFETHLLYSGINL